MHLERTWKYLEAISYKLSLSQAINTIYVLTFETGSLSIDSMALESVVAYMLKV
jgi:hypothetical protein